MNRIWMRVSVLMTSLILTVTTLILTPALASADSMPSDPGNVLTPSTVTADGLPTVQIDGVVWSQVIVGNTVFAGGSFSTARPAGAAVGTNTVSRRNLLAYNLESGELIASFVADFNGQVTALAASPDGTRLYVGGDFTQLNGQPASRLVALDPKTASRINGFDPKPSNAVRAIVATKDTVYFAGAFFNVGTAGREEIAAVRAVDGTLHAWRPVIAGGKVNALALSPDGSKIAVGGAFTSVNGSTANGLGLAVIDTGSAAIVPYAAAAYVKNGGSDGAITSLSSDSESFYASGYTFGPNSTLEGIVAIKWNDLTTKWLEDCHGDTHSVYAAEGAVYLAGHPHYCGNVGGFPQEDNWTFNRALAFSKATAGTISREIYGYKNFEGFPRPELQNWFPSLNSGTYTGQSQGPWNVTGNRDYVVYGGEFTRVNFKDQQGLVRFAVKSKAPNLRGPVDFADAFVPTVTSPNAGVARIRWRANYDLDNKTLTYKVIRDGNTAQPVHTVVADSTFWLRQGMVFYDTGLAPGSTHTYRIFATDPTGRESRGNPVEVVVSGTSPDTSAYRSIVLADGPQNYWRLDESTTANGMVDAAGADDLASQGAIGLRQNGALTPDTNNSIALSGATLLNPTRQNRTDSFSLELWFNASSTQQGRLMGYGSSPTGNSAKGDRHLYLNSSGNLYFGVIERGTKRTINSSRSYNDNKWHHAVATLGDNGMNLYVDGALAASLATAKTAFEMEGYWRLGGDNLSGWSSAPSTPSFAGGLDEVAIYPRPLNAAQILNHYRAGTGSPDASVPLTSTPVPTITGTTKVGSTLTANAGTWAPSPVTLTYQWLRNGQVIFGATASTYKLVAADAGQTLTVTATGSKPGYTTTTKTSAAASVPLQKLTATPTPAIKGTAKVGSTLTASAGTWSPSPVALKYQWLRNGQVISGASASTYKLVAADAGKKVAVTVTGTKPGYTTTAKTSTATSVPLQKLAATPASAIKGTVKVGSTLTAKAGTWKPAPVALKYQWKRNGKPITGATKARYTLVAADAGKKISVTVTGSTPGYTTTAKTSAAASVPLQKITNTPKPTITGKAKSGSRLTVKAGRWKPTQVTLKYQWKRNGKSISGASKTSYKLAKGDKGKKITVTVTGSKAGYKKVSKTSSAKSISR